MQHSEKKQPVSVKKLLLILIGSAAGLTVLIAGYFHEKYTGGNLRSLLAEHENMRFVVGYVNTDFADAPDFPLLRSGQPC